MHAKLHPNYIVVFVCVRCAAVCCFCVFFLFFFFGKTANSCSINPSAPPDGKHSHRHTHKGTQTGPQASGRNIHKQHHSAVHLGRRFHAIMVQDSSIQWLRQHWVIGMICQPQNDLSITKTLPGSLCQARSIQPSSVASNSQSMPDVETYLLVLFGSKSDTVVCA